MRAVPRVPTVNPMGTPRTILAIATVALLPALAACVVKTNTLVDGLTPTTPVTEIRLNGSGSADLTVTADDTITGLDLRRTVHYAHTKPPQTARIEGGGTLVLDTECGFDCSIVYDVRTGSGVRVSGSTGSGDIRLTRVGPVDLTVHSGDLAVTDAAGPVTLRTNSGDITLTGASSNVDVHTDSGDIQGRNLSAGTVRAEATSGDITLDLATVGAATAETTSGDIEVRVPDHSCRIDANATSGDVHVNVTSDPGSGHVLTLRATSGDITVSAR